MDPKFTQGNGTATKRIQESRQTGFLDDRQTQQLPNIENGSFSDLETLDHDIKIADMTRDLRELESIRELGSLEQLGLFINNIEARLEEIANPKNFNALDGVFLSKEDFDYYKQATIPYNIGVIIYLASRAKDYLKNFKEDANSAMRFFDKKDEDISSIASAFKKNYKNIIETDNGIRNLLTKPLSNLNGLASLIDNPNITQENAKNNIKMIRNSSLELIKSLKNSIGKSKENIEDIKKIDFIIHSKRIKLINEEFSSKIDSIEQTQRASQLERLGSFYNMLLLKSEGKEPDLDLIEDDSLRELYRKHLYLISTDDLFEDNPVPYILIFKQTKNTELKNRILSLLATYFNNKKFDGLGYSPSKAVLKTFENDSYPGYIANMGEFLKPINIIKGADEDLRHRQSIDMESVIQEALEMLPTEKFPIIGSLLREAGNDYNFDQAPEAPIQTRKGVFLSQDDLREGRRRADLLSPNSRISSRNPGTNEMETYSLKEKLVELEEKKESDPEYARKEYLARLEPSEKVKYREGSQVVEYAIKDTQEVQKARAKIEALGYRLESSLDNLLPENKLAQAKGKISLLRTKLKKREQLSDEEKKTLLWFAKTKIRQEQQGLVLNGIILPPQQQETVNKRLKLYLENRSQNPRIDKKLKDMETAIQNEFTNLLITLSEVGESAEKFDEILEAFLTQKELAYEIAKTTVTNEQVKKVVIEYNNELNELKGAATEPQSINLNDAAEETPKTAELKPSSKTPEKKSFFGNIASKVKGWFGR